MLTLLIILAVVYIGLKIYNTNDEFKRRDREREAEQADAGADEAEE